MGTKGEIIYYINNNNNSNAYNIIVNIISRDKTNLK